MGTYEDVWMVTANRQGALQNGSLPHPGMLVKEQL